MPESLGNQNTNTAKILPPDMFPAEGDVNSKRTYSRLFDSLYSAWEHEISKLDNGNNNDPSSVVVLDIRKVIQAILTSTRLDPTQAILILDKKIEDYQHSSMLQPLRHKLDSMLELRRLLFCIQCTSSLLEKLATSNAQTASEITDSLELCVRTKPYGVP